MSSSAERSDSASFYLSFVSILVLSTATNQTEVALIQNRRILFQKKWPSNYDEAEKLIPALANLFKKMSPPEAILIVSGPGNFTGLRIGVTIANTLAFCYSIPLFSISTFEYLQKKIPRHLDPKTAVMLKAGGNFFALKLPKTTKYNILERQEIPRILQKKDIHFLITDLKPFEKKKFALPAKITWLSQKKQKSFTQVVQAFMKEKPKSQKIVKPFYLKPPAITKSKKTLFV